MRQLVFTLAVVLSFALACFAQATTPGNQSSGAQGTNPTTGTSSTGSASGSQSGSMGSQSSASGSMGQTSSSDTSAKGEKKLKGCIESQGGQYMLNEKGGKQVKLTGSADLASHVGHQVTVHGSYQASTGAASNSGADKMPSASGSTTANPSASASSSDQEFMVTKIDHESDTCKIKGANSGSSGMSGASSSGTQAPDHQ